MGLDRLELGHEQHRPSSERIMKLLECRAWAKRGREAANARGAIMSSFLLICWYGLTCEEGAGAGSAARVLVSPMSLAKLEKSLSR